MEFRGAVERKRFVVVLFCLSLGNVELLELTCILNLVSEFLSWPARQAFPPGGEELERELRWAEVYLVRSASITVHLLPG